MVPPQFAGNGDLQTTKVVPNSGHCTGRDNLGDFPFCFPMDSAKIHRAGALLLLLVRQISSWFSLYFYFSN